MILNGRSTLPDLTVDDVAALTDIRVARSLYGCDWSLVAARCARTLDAGDVDAARVLAAESERLARAFMIVCREAMIRHESLAGVRTLEDLLGAS